MITINLSTVYKSTKFFLQMSDFFAGLTGGNIRQPESQFNVGPLPSIANGPPGINADADGKYNFNSNLLEGIKPYTYGQGRMGSDRSYQQVPHRMQQIIPLLHLPHADPKIEELVPLSHAVDQGDIAFVLGTHRVQGVLFDRTLQMDSNIARSQLPARNAFVNLPTCNYLLAGLQRLSKNQHVSFISTNRPIDAWSRLAQDLDFDPADQDQANEMMKLLRTAFVPYGICAGSENQGGQHETGFAPVQAAVNHVTTMTVDGQNRDLVNFWRRYNLNGGDQLILRFEYLPTRSYTLNHYYKGMVHQVFPTQEVCWQIVPDVYRTTYDTQKFDGIPRNVCDFMEYDYRIHGYWRIGQMFHHRGKNDSTVNLYSDDTVFLQGALLQITFAPVWVQHERPFRLIHRAIPTAHAKKNSAQVQQAVRKRKFAFGLGGAPVSSGGGILPTGAPSGLATGLAPTLHFGSAAGDSSINLHLATSEDPAPTTTSEVPATMPTAHQASVVPTVEEETSNPTLQKENKQPKKRVKVKQTASDM